MAANELATEAPRSAAQCSGNSQHTKHPGKISAINAIMHERRLSANQPLTKKAQSTKVQRPHHPLWLNACEKNCTRPYDVNVQGFPAHMHKSSRDMQNHFV